MARSRALTAQWPWNECYILNKTLSPITVMMTSPMEWNFFVLHDRRNIKFVFGQMGNRIKTDFGLEYVPSALVVKKKNREGQKDWITKPKFLCNSTCEVIKINSCSKLLVLSIGLYISIQSPTILTPYSQIKDNKNNILKSWTFFKSSNKMIHPTVFLILRVDRIECK